MKNSGDEGADRGEKSRIRLVFRSSPLTNDFMDNLKPYMVIAHPGHELRVFHWLELNRPHVLAWTNGAGKDGVSRLDSTRRLLSQAGSTLEEGYGGFADTEVYGWILEKQTEPFVRFAEFLLKAWTKNPPSLVVGDAIEGYNTSHDFCRYVINAACEAFTARTGKSLPNLDFLLAGRPDARMSGLPGGINLKLDEAAVDRKLMAAKNYPELQAEVEAALSKFGPNAFAVESLSPVDLHEGLNGLTPEPPYYEIFGEKRVAEGRYKNVIRYREHVVPVVKEVRRQLDLSD